MNTTVTTGRPADNSFQADEPHTLAQFVTYSSEGIGLVVKGLPIGLSAKDAAQLLGKRTDIKLKPLPVNYDYFSGWFDNGWSRRVETMSGELLFTITIGDRHLGRFHFVLTIEAAALKLLAEA